jgi:hypothetical protein
MRAQFASHFVSGGEEPTPDRIVEGLNLIEIKSGEIMRGMFWVQGCRIVVAMLVAIILATIIDPYLGWHSSLEVQIVNGILPALSLLFVWGLTGRFWMGATAEVVLLGLLRYADYAKYKYLNTDLAYADFTVIGGLLREPRLVLGFVELTPKKISIIILVLVVAILAGLISGRTRRASKLLRIVCVALALTVFSILWMMHVPPVIPSLGWEVFIQSVGARQVGVAGNILLGRMAAKNVAKAADAGAIRAFWNEPLVQQAEYHLSANIGDIRPDIVILQSESLFEPSQLCGFSDNPILKRAAQEQPALPGNLRVPVFGGRTLQTEFEVLTGAPISFYPGSMFAYYELIKGPINAMPRVLSELGYETTVIHPGARGFWRRDVVMPEMGFESYLDAKSFITPAEFSDRQHVDDLTLMRAILAQLDTSNRPAFVMAISINNHGPWGAYAPKFQGDLGLPDMLQGGARQQLADYVANAIKADQAYGFLLDALKRRGRPTIVLMYGDHLPGLASVYSELCFKDGKPPAGHFPPYRVWSNFPIPVPPPVTYSYLLQGWLLRAAGIPLKGQLEANALAGFISQDQAISSADRNRILYEYANIAAANIDTHDVPVKNASTMIFINGDQAWGILRNYVESPNGSKGGVKESADELLLTPLEKNSADADFKLNGGFSWITLRPYVQCLDKSQNELGNVAVKADGRLIYRASVGPNLLRLANLDVRGVRELSIHADWFAQSTCKSIYVKVAQMQCYSSDCSVPGPAAQANAALSSRILFDDPAVNDINDIKKMDVYHFDLNEVGEKTEDEGGRPDLGRSD